MHDRTEQPTFPSTPWRTRLAHAWGVGLLLALVVIFSAYAWTARETGTAGPATLVTLRPHLRGSASSIDVVPYQHAISTVQPTCIANAPGQLCLIIGTDPANHEPMTFT